MQSLLIENAFHFILYNILQYNNEHKDEQRDGRAHARNYISHTNGMQHITVENWLNIELICCNKDINISLKMNNE